MKINIGVGSFVIRLALKFNQFVLFYFFRRYYC